MPIILYLLTLIGLVGLSVAAQDGPLTNAANIPVRTDANGYLIVAEQTYGGPDGPRRVFGNQLVRTDANGYLIVTNPTGFGTGSFAPIDEEFWVGAASTDLTAEHDLSALSTGLVVNTSGTPSAYGGTSCTNQFPQALNASGAATCASVDLTTDVTGTLPVGNGGTGTSTTFTAGSVIFAGASGVYSQDNSNFFFDDTNDFLGIGTSPDINLHVHDPTGLSAIWTTTDIVPSSTAEYVAHVFTTDHDGTRDIAAVAFDVNNDNLLRLVNDASATADHVQIDTSGNLESGGTITGTRLIAEVSTGTAPLTVSSTTLVSNLNADLLDGQTGSYYTDLANVSGTLAAGNGGTGATTLTDGGLLLGSGTGAITALGVATNGQIPIGDGTTDPVLATLTGTATEIEVTNGAGSITVGLPDDVNIDGILTLGFATTNAQMSMTGTFNASGGFGVNAGWALGTALVAVNGTTTRIAAFDADGSITTQNNSETIANVATMILDEPNITIGSDTITNASTLRIVRAPTEGTNNYALWVDAGATRLDGTLGVGTASPGSQVEIENTASANDVLLLEDSSGLCEAQPTTTGLTWSCSSDERLKRAIGPPDDVLAWLQTIPLHSYIERRSGDRVGAGIVAQRLQRTHPQFVSTARVPPDSLASTPPPPPPPPATGDAPGPPAAAVPSPDDYVDMYMATHPTTWDLVRAIQQLAARLDTLEQAP